ncbi:unnamed protein product [Phytophthora fragariaefolia]|uniref:Unnamed protein product n=1 Tax=Phytophthora fragariaefolia TaxID=1490495 RepID=A0A9W6XXR8_9STRA|nr:unnamed protein product [Phytophthora fragariaefolia]
MHACDNRVDRRDTHLTDGSYRPSSTRPSTLSSTLLEPSGSSTSKPSRSFSTYAAEFRYASGIRPILMGVFAVWIDHRELQAVQDADRFANGPRKRVLDHGCQASEEEEDPDDPAFLFHAVFRGVSHLHADRNVGGTAFAASLH